MHQKGSWIWHGTAVTTKRPQVHDWFYHKDTMPCAQGWQVMGAMPWLIVATKRDLGLTQDAIATTKLR